jgi:hypothetical protein
LLKEACIFQNLNTSWLNTEVTQLKAEV